MALIKCPECKNKVSDKADSCPKCGFNISTYTPPVKPEKREFTPEEQKKANKGCLIGIVVVLLLGAIGSLIPDEDKKSSPSNSSTPSIVKNLPWDNSVIPVKNHIKNNLKDPSSLEFIDWGSVIKTADGTYVVAVKYRAKNSFGGYVAKDQIYTMNSRGDILKVNDY